jgi:hypothetical protein
MTDVDIKNCGDAVKNVSWCVGSMPAWIDSNAVPSTSYPLGCGRSQNMDDGSKIKGMESAASYVGSTNPGGTFK